MHASDFFATQWDIYVLHPTTHPKSNMRSSRMCNACQVSWSPTASTTFRAYFTKHLVTLLGSRLKVQRRTSAVYLAAALKGICHSFRAWRLQLPSPNPEALKHITLILNLKKAAAELQ